MFDAGLIELEYEKDSNERAFCLTQRGVDLFKAGVLCPKSQLPKNQVSLPA
jgi:hypothetical protein